MSEIIMHFSRKIPPQDFDVCLYHDHCPDGIGAAWCFWNIDRSTKKGPSDEGQIERIKTQGVNHNEPPPLDLVRGKNVVIVDFCYNRETTKKLCSISNYVLILDHHDTAQRSLEGLGDEVNNVDYIFNMGLSGAQITWDYVNPGIERPWFIEYIADRDLWKWELPQSREIGKALHQGSWYTFEGMDILHHISDKERVTIKEELYKSGKLLIEAEERDISYATYKSTLCEFMGYRVRLATCSPIIRSEVGSELCKKGDCDFAAVWRYDFETDQWWISLRCNKDCEIPLNKICEKYGGGGHNKACGFAIHGRYSKEWMYASSEKRCTLAHGDLHDYFVPVRT